MLEACYLFRRTSHSFPLKTTYLRSIRQQLAFVLSNTKLTLAFVVAAHAVFTEGDMFSLSAPLSGHSSGKRLCVRPRHVLLTFNKQQHNAAVSDGGRAPCRCGLLTQKSCDGGTGNEKAPGSMLLPPCAKLCLLCPPPPFPVFSSRSGCQ